MQVGPTIQADEGRINERILARLAHADYLAEIEAPRRRYPARFYSPDIKRMFLRNFDTMQVNMHFVSVFARTRLPEPLIAAMETSVLDKITAINSAADQAIASAHALFAAHGIMTPAAYDAQPLDVEVRVISKFGRRYLELMTKIDELMPLLETLSIDDVISQAELQSQKQTFKKGARSISAAARTYAGTARNKMLLLEREELAAKGRKSIESSPADQPALPTDTILDPAASTSVVVQMAPRQPRSAQSDPAAVEVASETSTAAK